MSKPPDEPVYQWGTRIPLLGDLNDVIPACGPTHAFVWYACQASSLPPPVFYIATILPILAYEAARRGYVFANTNARPCIQSALVAPPAAGKSSAMRMPIAFYKDALRTAQGSAYRNPFVQAEGSTPGIVEKVTTFLDPSTRSTPTILYYEEFSRLLEQRDGFAEVFNQVFDGEDFDRALIRHQKEAREGGAPPATIVAPAVSAIFATTFAALEATNTSTHRGGGFFTRLLWFTGEGQDFTLERDPALSARTAALHEWAAWSRYVSDTDFSSSRPKILSMSSACNPIFNVVLKELNTLKRESGGKDPHIPFLVRLLERAQQIAMLYAFSRGELVASEDDATRAVGLLRVCEEAIKTVRGEWTSGSMVPADQAARCQEAIEAAGPRGIGLWELSRATRKMTRGMREQALAMLEDQKHVRVISSNRGGRVYQSMKFSAAEAQRLDQLD